MTATNYLSDALPHGAGLDNAPAGVILLTQVAPYSVHVLVPDSMPVTSVRLAVLAKSVGFEKHRNPCFTIRSNANALYALWFSQVITEVPRITIDRLTGHKPS